MICPKCGSGRLRRSHTRGIKEKFLKKLGYKAFRCREKECDWRGLVNKRLLRIKRSGVFSKLNLRLFLLVAFIIMLPLFILILSSMNNI